jgi:hypothetical protein
MSNLEPTQAETVRRAQDARLEDDFKVEVGSVMTYYSTAHEADIALGCQRPCITTDGEITYEQSPILPHVPVICFGTKRSFFKTPLAAGDTVLLLFTGRSPAEFMAGQDDSRPTDLARHSLSNAMALPFVRPGSATGGTQLALLSDVQALLTVLQGWMPVPNDGGAALKTAMASVTIQGTSEVLAK